MLRTFSVSAIAVAIMTIAARAQEPALGTDFGDRLDVRVVNVDVVVVDKRGNPVTDLERDDFVLFEDGEPVAITNFYRADPALRENTPPPPTGVVTAAASSGGEEGGGERRAPEPMVLAVYVDNLHLTQHRRNSYLEQMRAFLTEHLRAGDRVMVIDQRHGLEIVETFSGDGGVIDRALAGILDALSDGLEDRARRRQVYGEILRVLRTVDRLPDRVGEIKDPCNQFFEEMLAPVRSYADWVRGIDGASIQNLAQIITSLGALPGRKSLLYLGSGIQTTPAIDLFDNLGTMCPERRLDALRAGNRIGQAGRLHELTRIANSARISIYTIDGEGTEAKTTTAVDVRPIRIDTFHGPRTFDPRPTPEQRTLQRQNRQDSLFVLANETGGRAMLDGNDVSLNLLRMDRDQRSYYALGFTPARAPDGRMHRLRVALAEPRKGVELRYRRTYLHRDDEGETTQRNLAALLFGFEENPLGIALSAGAATRDRAGHYVLPLQIAIPLAKILLLPDDGFYEGAVQIVISRQDQRDRPVEMRRQEVPIRIADAVIEAARARAHLIEVAVPIAAGETLLGIAVRDKLGGVTSFLSHSATVAPTAAEVDAGSR